MANVRNGIFAQSVLVLSQCDTVSSDFYNDLRSLLQPGSFAQMHPQYPFGHVVGVINKFNNYSALEPHQLTHSELITFWHTTQNLARDRFKVILQVNDDMNTACGTMCTTAALFRASDHIMSSILRAELGKAVYDLHNQLVQSVQHLLRTCCLPARYYLTEDMDLQSVPCQFQHMLREFKEHAARLVKSGLEGWFNKTLHNWTEIAKSFAGLPSSLRSLLGSVSADMQVKNWVKNMKELVALSYKHSVEGGQAGSAFQAHVGIAQGVDSLSENLTLLNSLLDYESMHDLSRFPLLVAKLQEVFLTDLPKLLKEMTEEALAYLDSIYEDPSAVFTASNGGFKTPTEKHLAILLHKMLRGISEHYTRALESLPDTGTVIYRQLLIEEDSAFRLREAAHTKVQSLLNQYRTVLDCLKDPSTSSSLQHIRDALENGIARMHEHTQLPTELQDVWWGLYVREMGKISRKAVLQELDRLFPSLSRVTVVASPEGPSSSDRKKKVEHATEAIVKDDGLISLDGERGILEFDSPNLPILVDHDGDLIRDADDTSLSVCQMMHTFIIIVYIRMYY
ncbi:hypothetical protein EON65_26935 [archaeon]|nr:MAG: hypothetical protein EON65_26935 [archaeon]